MIKFNATALVHNISPVIEVSEKFQKRELILDDSWERDGKRYSNFVVVEFTGDKMAQLDNYYPGQRVTVEGIITGREHNNRIFNTVKGQTVVMYQPQTQYTQAAATPMPGGYQQQSPYQAAPGYQAAPMPGNAYQPQPAYQQQQPAYPQQQAPAYPQPPQQPPRPQQAVYQQPPAQPPYPQQGHTQAPGAGTPPLPPPPQSRQQYQQAAAPGAADLPFAH